MADSTSKVCVVIPNWNGKRWLPGCLNALAAQTFKDFAVVVVDNGSTDGSQELLRTGFPQVHILPFAENRGFAAAGNAGIRQTESEYVVLLNNDTIPRPDWLANLVRAIDSAPPNVGCLASKMIDMTNPGVMENAGDTLSWQGAAEKRGRGAPTSEFVQLEEVLSPCAGAALYRRSFLADTGGFDERFFAYLEDVDLGLRGRLLGYTCLFVPSAEVLHQGHGSGMPHGRYVRLITRNRLVLLLKNIPGRLLRRHLVSLVYGQFYFFVCYRRPLHSLAGCVSLIPLLPHALRQRRHIGSRRTLSEEQIDALLKPAMNEPTLRKAFSRWIHGSRI